MDIKKEYSTPRRPKRAEYSLFWTIMLLVSSCVIGVIIIVNHWSETSPQKNNNSVTVTTPTDDQKNLLSEASPPKNNNSVTVTTPNNNRQNIYQIVAFIGGMATVTTFEMLVKPKTRNKD